LEDQVEEFQSRLFVAHFGCWGQRQL